MSTPPAGRRLTVVVAPDSFKGSLTSVQVATALRDGWLRARPGDEVLLAPLADGGEGTLVAIEAAGGWEWQETRADDPLGRPIRARWLRSSDGLRAVVELAEASGLSRVAPAERDPMAATGAGTGQLLLAALSAGVRHVVLGIGGSATTDGGAGIVEQLGGRIDGDAVDLTGLDPRLAELDLRIACDVSNPLLGEKGAAATYGPQKGASPEQVRRLDAALGGWADRLERATGCRERDTAGAGAAGGVGFALLCLRDRFRSLDLVPGVELVMDETDLDGKLARADLVITGEGRIDEQTAYGKTALGVARRAHARGIPTIAVGGGVTPEGIDALAPFGAVVVPVVEWPQSVEDAMAAGTAPVERCAERIARLVSIGSLR
ncbi:MAG: glycerate kinase [Chloroflexota bacterium]|nr:glycerate kinase [Chloroflexota bacterium]